MHVLRITSAAGRDLGKLSRQLSPREFDRLGSVIGNLATDPRPHGSLKLKGGKRVFRLRVGHYRVIYEISDSPPTVTVSRVVRRSESTYDL